MVRKAKERNKDIELERDTIKEDVIRLRQYAYRGV